MPGVGSGKLRCLKNTCIRNLRDPADAKLALMLLHHVRRRMSLHAWKATFQFQASFLCQSNEMHFSGCIISHIVMRGGDKNATCSPSWEKCNLQVVFVLDIHTRYNLPSSCIQESTLEDCCDPVTAIFPGGEILVTRRTSKSSRVSVVPT